MKNHKNKVTFTKSEVVGASFDSPVVIDKNTTQDGIAEEYAYLKQKYGNPGEDFILIQQRLLAHNGKMFDILTIDVDENKIDIYFNIDNFYGK